MEGLSQVPQQGGQQPDAQEAEAKRAQEEQMRRDLMATVLDSGARERRESYSSSVTSTSDSEPRQCRGYPLSAPKDHGRSKASC